MTLLELCTKNDKVKGGSIHGYLHRLNWKKEKRRHKDAPLCYLLLLDNHKKIASIHICKPEDLPAIMPDLLSDKRINITV